MVRTKNKGWKGESRRHALAARGIKSGTKNSKTPVPIIDKYSRGRKVFEDSGGNTIFIKRTKKPDKNGKFHMVDQYAAYNNEKLLLRDKDLYKMLDRAGIDRRKAIYRLINSPGW